MRQCIPIGLLGLTFALLACRPAMAQKDILDNIILLGPAETLNLPGVNRIEERPEEKNPPRPYRGTIEDVPTHQPLSTRFEPGQGYILEESGSLLEARRQGPGSVESGASGKPTLPEALTRPTAPHSRGDVDAARHELDDPGPPGGLDLDAALDRLVHFNRDLRTKYHEIPQARADTLTAGLRGNPIIFWSAGGTPYGRWTNQPGTRSYPLVITYLLDFTGRRVARVRMARVTERVLEARYQDEVRLKAAELDAAFVEALAARVQEKLGWLEGYRSALEEWSGYQAVIDSVFDFVRHRGLYLGAGFDLAAAVPAASGGAGELRAELIHFVRCESLKTRIGERLPETTEVVESCFGKLKALEDGQSKSGFTGLVLSLGAMVSDWTAETISEALEQCRVRDVVDWCRRMLGRSVQSQRRQAYNRLEGATKPG